ncbi:hypothetical protein D3C80_921450 [compost metagenome]
MALSKALTITVCAADAADVHPAAVVVTVYEPAALTVIACDVAPFDQVFPLAAEEVNVTDPPGQKVVGPPGVTVGAAGNALIVRGVLATSTHPYQKPLNIPSSGS